MTKPRTDRTPDAMNPAPHSLALSVKGTAGRKGTHICTCGKRFSGFNQFERHRAEQRKADRDLAG